jgi:ribosomal protein S21
MANTNIKINKREKDSSVVLLHKFQKKVQESGILPKVRGKRYNTREESKSKIKKGKLKKLVSAAKYEDLKRQGKLVRKARK